MNNGDGIREYFRKIEYSSILYSQYATRRSWGTYYAVWSVAFLTFIVVVPKISADKSLGIYAEYISVILDLAAIIVGTFISVRIFTKAAKMLMVTGTVKNFYDWKGTTLTKKVFILSMLSGFIFLLISIFYTTEITHNFQGGIDEFLYFLLFLLSLYLVYSARVMFIKIPFEAWVAILSYMAASLGSIASIGFVLNPSISVFIIKSLWSIVTALWIFSAMYAFYMAPEEIVENE